MTHRHLILMPWFLVTVFTMRGVTPYPSLQIDIDGLRTDHGAVRCFLYSSARGFPKDQSVAISRATGTILSGKSTCVFVGVPDGLYAISAYHDENGNGRLDTNFIGIPKEGVGASNDAKAHIGPPKFKEAAMKIDASRRTLMIHIHYL